MHAGGSIDKYLLDPRQRPLCQFATDFGIDRHRTPARDLEFALGNRSVDFSFDLVSQIRILAQKDRAGSESFAQSNIEIRGNSAQKSIRGFDQQSAAVAGFAVGCNRAAVGESRQRRDRGLHKPVTRLVIEICNEAEAATVVLEPRLIQSVCKFLCHDHTGDPQLLRAPLSLLRLN